MRIQQSAILSYDQVLREFSIIITEWGNWNHTGGEYTNTLTIHKDKEKYSIRLTEYNRETDRERTNTIHLTINELEKYLTLINQPQKEIRK